MPEKVLELGSAVVECAFMYEYELDWAKKRGTSFYRSKEKKVSTNPFTSYLMNKKWTLEEEFNKHLLNLHQVTVSSIFTIKYNLTLQAGLQATEVGFKEEPEDDEPEPLEMEHIHLPVGLWCVGTLISLLCLIAEIIIHRKTDVTIARLESENPGEIVLNKCRASRLSDTEGAENNVGTEV